MPFSLYRFSKPKTPLPVEQTLISDSPQRFLNDILGLFSFPFPTPASFLTNRIASYLHH